MCTKSMRLHVYRSRHASDDILLKEYEASAVGAAEALSYLCMRP
jgi:hypothetical protein